MWNRSLVAVGFGLLLWCGCKKSQTPAAPAPEQPTPAQPESPLARLQLDHALPKLPTVKLWLGAEELLAEVADDPPELATGMMFRKNLGENEGMLFVFSIPYRISFYTKNVSVPLSVAYINAEGVIQEIYDLPPLREAPVYSKSDRVQYALEVNQGWFRRHNIGVGAEIRTEAGSLRKMLMRGRPAPAPPPATQRPEQE